MKLFVAGTRGIPDIPGGVERHCEQLYPLIAGAGHQVTLARRSWYITDTLVHWNGIDLVDLYTPKSKRFEAIIHTLIAVLSARLRGAQMVHIHAIGPALVTPLARMLGMKVVFTHHGPDYDRQKWGKAARLVLKLGESMGCRWANEVIVISQVIQNHILDCCNRRSTLIPNGVPLPDIRSETDFLRRLGVEPGNYLLALARLVPEKGLHDLIDAFEELSPDCKLVIAGDSDHEDSYSRSLKARAAADERILMPGYVKGTDLSQLLSHARLFVMPSYHEGLPIALLEALSYGLPVLVSDIPANLEVGLAEDAYFATGDVKQLVQRLEERLAAGSNEDERNNTMAWVRERYNWQRIAEQTIAVYRRALNQTTQEKN